MKITLCSLFPLQVHWCCRGIFVCVSYAVRVGAKAIDVVTGTEQSSGLVPPTATKVSGAKSKWAGGDIRTRGKALNRLGRATGKRLVVDRDSPYGSRTWEPRTALYLPHTFKVPRIFKQPWNAFVRPPPSVTLSSFVRCRLYPHPLVHVHLPLTRLRRKPALSNTPSLLPVRHYQPERRHRRHSFTQYFPLTPGPSDSSAMRGSLTELKLYRVSLDMQTYPCFCK